jgi:catechol 2,3-dioxygenase-like lactoylglutathione lyase family enzyme
MIIPNLMVTDMAASLAFYRGQLGLELVTAISATRDILGDTTGSDAVFVILAGQGGQLMLQTAASLREELPALAAQPAYTGTIYLRGLDPRPLTGRFASTQIVKPLERQWYGMLELYVRDPDGYIVCLAAADGPPHA